MATHLCSCLENPRDGGAWWAAVSGVTQSRTRLKRLSSSSSSPFSGSQLIVHYPKIWIHKEFAVMYVKSCPVYIFLKNFIVSIFILRYTIWSLFLSMVSGSIPTLFSFSWLKKPSECPSQRLLPIYIPSISGGGFPLSPHPLQHLSIVECLTRAVPSGVM